MTTTHLPRWDLETIVALGLAVAQGGITDARPEWLQALPGAMHPGEPYYHFLYELLLRTPFRSCLEIGTRGGTSALHMAAGRPDAHIVTLDINPECKPNVEAIARANGLSNLDACVGDWLYFRPKEEFDLLFIDGVHTMGASLDYQNFRRDLRPHGIILFDDTRLNAEMKAAWKSITDRKIEVPELHYMGFGIAIKESP